MSYLVCRSLLSLQSAHRAALRQGTALALVLALAAAGCAGIDPPANHGELYAPEARRVDHTTSSDDYAARRSKCQQAGTADYLRAAAATPQTPRRAVPPLRYSPGDRINVFVYGSPEFSGDNVINADGTLILPYAGAVRAGGRSNNELTKLIETAYLSSGIFTREGLRVTVRPVQFAPVNVTVAGAVFYPGRHTVGGIKDSDKLDRVLARFGDNPLERFVPSGLRAAGGVRPDADISRIVLVRDGKRMVLDWRGAIAGAPVEDLPLIEGDHLEVPESGCFQSALVRPSQITPPGIRFTYSNMTAPVFGNANTIQSHQFSGSLPYGTRLLQGLVQANCVGGTVAVNARRYAVLITRNPKTQQTEVIQRSVEELVRSPDRDTINPFLMPDDAIACYDSAMVELRDVLGVVGAAVNPAASAKTAFGR